MTSPAGAPGYLDRLRSYIDEYIVPAEARLGHDEELVIGRVAETMMPGLREAARQAAVYLPQMPVEYGGQDVPVTTLVQAAEMCGPYRLAPIALNCMAPDEGNMHLLLQFGTGDQKQRWLRPLADGAIRSCFAMTEPDAGSDPRRISSRAERLPGGGWRINAHKVFTSSAQGASLALVMVVTDPGTDAHAGQTIFLVPTSIEGFSIVRDIKTMGTHGFAGHAETRFTDVAVGPDAVLGEPGQGFAIAQSRLGVGRLGHAMRWIGIAQRSLDLAAARAQSRETFGAPLASRQAVQWWLADDATKLYACRLMVLDACRKIENGLPHRTEISMIKTFVAETFGEVVDHALQVHGGWGYTTDFPFEAWYRDARAARIYDGPSEVHRMLVARQLLKEVSKSGTAATVASPFTGEPA
jgi:alkylation response protein AidB-like acyl-CoA dehydrogenase